MNEQRLSLPRNHPIFEGIKNIAVNATDVSRAPKVDTVYEASAQYYHALPSLIGRAQEEMFGSITHPPITPQYLKQTALVDPHTFSGLLYELGANKQDPVIVDSLTQTVPRLLALTEMSRTANDKTAIFHGMQTLGRQITQGTIETLSPMCPTYNYQFDKIRGTLSHQDGQILPTVGPRLALATTAFERVWEPLAKHGINVQAEFITYSGESHEGLVELGEDVVRHYRQTPSELLSNLQSAYTDLTNRVNQAFAATNIRPQMTSMETHVAPQVLNWAEEIQKQFTQARIGGQIINTESEQFEKWLQTNIGVKSSGWMAHYVNEETAYRRKQGIPASPTDPDVVTSAFKEAASYRVLQDRARKLGQAILDLETTHDYMTGSQPHLSQPTPVFMMREFNGRNPDDPSRIRQPFNIPTTI